MPSSPSSSASAQPRRKKAGTKKPAPKASGKPRAELGERLRLDAAAAAAAAAASAAAAAQAPPGPARERKKAIAAADAERAAATAKLKQLSDDKVPYLSPLAPLKNNEHGVTKAPYYSATRGAAAHKLPSVAADACGPVTSGWPADRRRKAAQLTAAQRARRGESTSTWSSREEKDVGLEDEEQPASKPKRSDFALPAEERPVEKQKRAMSLRVRFVHQTKDADGVHGAAAPAPGKKTRRDVRAGFELHSKAAQLAYNAFVKYIYALPAAARRSASQRHGFVYAVLVTESPTPFKFKCECEGQCGCAVAGNPAYDDAKAKYDAARAEVKAARNTHFGGKTLLETHPELRNVHRSVITQALRDVAKAFKSNYAKQDAQAARREQVKPFIVAQKDPRKRSSRTFCLPAEYIKAKHVLRPDLYNALEAKRAAGGKPPSKLRAHWAAQPRRRQWTKLELPPVFSGGRSQGEPTVVYLTRCADLKKTKASSARRPERVTPLGDVRFTLDQLGHWNCVVQRRPRKVRALRPEAVRKTVHIDPGVRDFCTGYSATEGKVVVYCSGDGGVNVIMERHLLKVDEINSELRKLKRDTNLNDPDAKVAYDMKARKLNHRMQRHYVKAKNLIKEMHCRVARDLTAKFDTIVLPPFKTKDMAQRQLMRDDGIIKKRIINSGTVRRMLMLKHFGYKLLLKHRCLCDGSEFAPPGEEYTTKACAYWCALLRARRPRGVSPSSSSNTCTVL